MQGLTKHIDIFDIEGTSVLYNLLTGSIIEIDDDVRQKIEKYFETQDMSVFNSDEISVLEENGFVQDDARVFLETKSTYHKTKYSDGESIKLDIPLTNMCNFCCPYCFEGADKKCGSLSVDPEIHRKLFDNIIRYLEDRITNNTKHLEIVWYGGEPLLEKDAIIQYGRKLNDFVHAHHMECSHTFITNGYLIDDDFIEQLKGFNISYFQITLDGPAEIHNKTRNMPVKTDTFSILIANANKLLNAGIEVVVRINIDKNNYVHVPKLFEQLQEKIPQKYFGTQFYVDIARIFGSKSSFTLLEYEQQVRPLMIEATRLKLMEPKVGVGALKAFCGAECNNSNLVVDLFGNTYTCWNYVFKDNLVSGNIEELVNKTHRLNELELHYIEDLSLDNVNNGNCLKCEYVRICMGMCPYIRKTMISGGQEGSYSTCKDVVRERVKTSLLAYYARYRNESAESESKAV